MRHLAYFFTIGLVLLLTSCVPAPPSPITVVQAPPPVIEPSAGPYWHSSGTGVTLNEALAYYAALKTLSTDELSLEHKRLLADMETATDHRLSALQLVLLSVLPGQTLVAPEQSVKFLENARQDADLHRQLADLFILLGDQLSTHVTVQVQSKQGTKTLRSTQKKLGTLAEDLTACRRERDDLADKLQKLQNIEHDLIERERKK